MTTKIMINKSSSEVESEQTLQAQQQEMLVEYEQNLDVLPIKYQPESLRFVVPASPNRMSRIIALDETNSGEKKLIFSALYTAYYLAYVRNTDNALKTTISDICPRFVDYLNQLAITQENNTEVLKLYEVLRVKEDQVKPQSTGLRELIRALNKALEFEPFGIDYLTQNEFRYLDLLTKTKPAADDESEQATLTDWFGFHSWLRRDDIGIGSELFNRAASPKLLVDSLKTTNASALIELHNSKHALINVFRQRKAKRKDFPVPPDMPLTSAYSDGKSSPQLKKDIAQYKKQVLNYKLLFFEHLLTLLPQSALKREDSVRVAMDALIYSQCTRNTITDVTDRLLNNSRLTQQATINGKIETIFRQNTPQCMLFTPSFILELVEYAEKTSNDSPVPTCKAEHYLFSTLMACQTVAVTDIFRLVLSNFKFLKRQNNRISHIECDYFKSRANRVHTTDIVDTRFVFGEAILTFIRDRTNSMSLKNTCLVNEEDIKKLKTGHLSIASTLFRFLSQSTIRAKIDKALAKEESSSVFLSGIVKVLDEGMKKDIFINKNLGNANDWMLKCESPCKGRLFGLGNIKNSSVHASSDTFDASQLANYRSHSNETERQYYLSNQNQVWLNNCGRITRAVMHDLQCNVLRPTASEKSAFQSDFTKATELIEQRKQNVLARLKVVTGQDQGRVDELGFNKGTNVVQGELPDSLFLIESAETVMKLKHYLSELQSKHERLALFAPDFLFYTALPTSEWIEAVFSNRLFNRHIVLQGERLYKKYKDHLPPLFVGQIGSENVN